MRRAAIVIGAGPAGLSAALGLLGAGHFVDILEQSTTPPKRRVCGAFVNPDGVASLRRLGLFDRAAETAAPVAAATVTGPRGRTASVFTVQDGTTGMAISRPDLERLLRAAVEERGGTIRAGARALRFARDGAGWRVAWRSDGAETSTAADALVVADGRFTLAAEAARPDPGWYGFNATFAGVGHAPGTLHLYFAARAYVGALTFADGTTNVCGLAHRRKGAAESWDDVAAAVRRGNRAFDALLSRARQTSDWNGVGPLPYSRAPRRLPGAMLAGDAAGVGDPFMGEGIGRALGTGPLIAAAAADGNPATLSERYTALWEAMYGARFALGWETRLLLDRPWLARFFIDLLLSPRFLDRMAGACHRGAGFVLDEGGRAPSVVP